MPKSGGDEGGSKGVRIDQRSLEMFTRYMQERAKPAKTRKKNEELAAEFDVPERTFVRRVEVVQRAMDELNSIADSLPAHEDEPDGGEVRQKSRPVTKDPGPLSRSVMEGKGSGETAVATAGREEYRSITMPDKNPLDGLTDPQISQAGVAVGIVFGGGLAKMGKALSETHRPLGDRAMEMAQGANATATTLLGIFESLRAFGIVGDGTYRTKVIDGSLVEIRGGEDERRQ